LTMLVAGSTVYLGGAFGHVNGAIRRLNAAAVSTSTGIVNGWNPAFSSTVRTLVKEGSDVFAGGDFTSENGGFGVHYFVPVDAITGDLDVNALGVSLNAPSMRWLCQATRSTSAEPSLHRTATRLPTSRLRKA